MLIISGYVYSDEIKDVIRTLSLFEVLVSIVLRILNRSKYILWVLMQNNSRTENNKQTSNLPNFGLSNSWKVDLTFLNKDVMI